MPGFPSPPGSIPGGWRSAFSKAFAKDGRDDKGGDDRGGGSSGSGKGGGGKSSSSSGKGSSGRSGGDDNGDRGGSGAARGEGGDDRGDDDGGRRGGDDRGGQGAAVRTGHGQQRALGRQGRAVGGRGRDHLLERGQEEIENGRFEQKDAAGRTVIERPATARDVARLDGNARRSRIVVPTGSGAPRVEASATAIEVSYPTGWREELEGDRYELKDPNNNTVIERQATSADVRRLRALAAR